MSWLVEDKDKDKDKDNALEVSIDLGSRDNVNTVCYCDVKNVMVDRSNEAYLLKLFVKASILPAFISLCSFKGLQEKGLLAFTREEVGQNNLAWTYIKPNESAVINLPDEANKFVIACKEDAANKEQPVLNVVNGNVVNGNAEMFGALIVGYNWYDWYNWYEGQDHDHEYKYSWEEKIQSDSSHNYNADSIKSILKTNEATSITFEQIVDSNPHLASVIERGGDDGGAVLQLRAIQLHDKDYNGDLEIDFGDDYCANISGKEGDNMNLIRELKHAVSLKLKTHEIVKERINKDVREK